MSKINRSRDDKPKLCRFGYVDYIILASTLAVAIAEEVNITDLSILSNFFLALGDQLGLIAAVKVGCESESESSSSEESTLVPPVPSIGEARSKAKTKKSKKVKKYKKV